MSKEVSSLQIEHLMRKIDEIKSIFPALKELAKGSEEIRDKVTSEITKFAMSIRSMRLDQDELNSFFDYPYVISKEKGDGEHQRHLAIPKFCDVQLGYLDRVTESFNVFVINPYVDLLGEIPDHVRKELDIPDPLDLKLEGDYLYGPDIEKAKKEFPEFIKSQTKDGRLLVDKSRYFEFLVKMIKKGIRPFAKKSIPQDCFVNRKCDFILRDYQEKIWKQFLEFSFCGIFIPPSTGKTFIGIYGTTHLKGPHIIAMRTTTLVEQWIERIELYTDLKVSDKYSDDESIDVFVFTYQSAIKYGHKRKWGLRIIDEAHHVPSNMFSKLLSIQCAYGMGLTASPFREDDRTPYIFAFTGHAIGLDWTTFRKLGIIQNPECHVWIVKNDKERIIKVKEILATHHRGKALIFCDIIEYGENLSKELNVPFVHGKSKIKLQALKDNDVIIGSRIFDEGISFDITLTIEVKWLFGSRSQELQRVTRSLHNSINKGIPGKHHIIFTAAEYIHDHKRLFSLYDKGFKIEIHREGVDEKVIEKAMNRSNAKKQNNNIGPRKIIPFETDHPVLSLPGIQKKLGFLNKKQQQLVTLLFTKDNKEFTQHQLAMLLGFANDNSFRVTIQLKKLKEMELIKIIHTKVSANLGLMEVV